MQHICSPTCGHNRSGLTRREFLTLTSMAAMAAAVPALPGQDAPKAAKKKAGAGNGGGPTHPLIDIHIHQGSDKMRGEGKKGGGGRTEAQFVAHQKALYGIGGVILGGNMNDYGFINENPGRYVQFAAAMAPGGDRAKSVEEALKKGARGIGEHRWEGESDPTMRRFLDMARDYKVPILFHFEEVNYPTGVYADFYKVIEKYPTVTFIGHAIDWWNGIDKNFDKKNGSYQRGRVTPGGLTDQWLTRYPNLYGDMSAGSGNTAIMRDPDHMKEFITRHQDKLMFGSDCTCTIGGMPTCWSAIKIVALNFLQLSPEIQDKIYVNNAAKMFGLKTA